VKGSLREAKQNKMISIIIPTHNSERQLLYLLGYLRRIPFVEYISEIIVADGDSKDRTIEVAESYDDVRIIRNDKASLAAQMNAGARTATGTILYFLHPDSMPPRDFAYEIVNHFENGYSSGCFRLQFDHSHWFLNFSAWFTRFNITCFRSGDQSLFIHRNLFSAVGGFSEDNALLGAQEMIDKVRGTGSFVVIPRYITSSARKYLESGIYRLQCIYFYIFTLYRFGVSQTHITRMYQHLMSS
jgi:rSAM/selenodomain-associated transferase 2